MGNLFMIEFVSPTGNAYFCFPYKVTKDLNRASLYQSLSKVNKAIKALKDDVKRMSRNRKSTLVGFTLVAEDPSENADWIFDVTEIRFIATPVKVVLNS